MCVKRVCVRAHARSVCVCGECVCVCVGVSAFVCGRECVCASVTVCRVCMRAGACA